MQRQALLALTVGLVACSEGSGPSEPVTPPVAAAAAIAIVSGDHQEGKANLRLAEPLVVRVTDDQGNGLASVAVSWSTTGLGSLASETLTNPDGFAETFFIPGMLGTSTVTASVAGLHISPVTFTVETTGLVIHIMASRSWGFGIYPDHVTVPVGTTIEWWSEHIPYSITAISVPQGEELFASGVLASSEHFQLVPAVAGTWEYSAREYDDLAPNGGAEDTGRITAQ